MTEGRDNSHSLLSGRCGSATRAGSGRKIAEQPFGNSDRLSLIEFTVTEQMGLDTVTILKGIDLQGNKQGRDAEKTDIPEGRVAKDDVISIRTFPDAELFRIVIRTKHLPGGRPLNAGAAGTPIFAVVCMWHC